MRNDGPPMPPAQPHFESPYSGSHPMQQPPHGPPQQQYYQQPPGPLPPPPNNAMYHQQQPPFDQNMVQVNKVQHDIFLLLLFLFLIEPVKK